MLTTTYHNAFFLWEFSKLSESAEQSLILSNMNFQIHSIFYCLFPELSSVDETLHLQKDLINSVRKMFLDLYVLLREFRRKQALPERKGNDDGTYQKQ